MEKIMLLERIIKMRPVNFILRRVFKVESIHFTFMQKYYSSDHSVDKNIKRIVELYTLVSKDMKFPEIQSFGVKFYSDTNQSVIFFQHETKKNKDISIH